MLDDTASPRIASGPDGYPIVGVLPRVGKQPLDFFLNAALEYGDVARLDFGARQLYLVSHPDAIKRVLQDNNRNYSKGYAKARPLFGDGLLTSEGEFWRRQRRLMQPAFHQSHIAALSSRMVGATAAMLEEWATAFKRGRPIDAAEEMMRLTQTIILDTMFSADIGADAEQAGRAFAVALTHLNTIMFMPFDLPPALMPGNRRFRRAMRTLDEVVYRLIARRRHAPGDQHDLLSMLLAARDEETGEGMSDRQLHDEVMTIFLAGHETTATALGWLWHLLSKSPGVERRLRSELATVLGERAPAFDDLPRLVYTRMVIDETLRLYPPAWMFARQAIEDDELCGYHIPAGAALVISPYVTHRLPQFWENPEGFDPERFTLERSAGRHKFAYFPFSGGPRKCIGDQFALVEATIVTAMVAQKYQLHLEPGKTVTPQPAGTLRPHPGVWVTLHQQIP